MVCGDEANFAMLWSRDICHFISWTFIFLEFSIFIYIYIHTFSLSITFLSNSISTSLSIAHVGVSLCICMCNCMCFYWRFWCSGSVNLKLGYFILTCIDIFCKFLYIIMNVFSIYMFVTSTRWIIRIFGPVLLVFLSLFLGIK